MMRSIVCAAPMVCSVLMTKVSGLGSRDGSGNPLIVAHLADEDDVGVSRRALRSAETKSYAHRRRPRWWISEQRPLMTRTRWGPQS